MSRRTDSPAVTGGALLLASTVGWPALQLGVFWLRFRRLPPEGADSALVFAPMGFVAGLVLLVLWIRAADARQRRLTLYGYLAAAPFALLGSLLSGLWLPGVWGPLALGVLPLCIGSAAGFALARRKPA